MLTKSGTIGFDEHFFIALLDSVADAVIVTDFVTRRIVYWNTGAELLFGYSAEEVVGQTADFLYPTHPASQRLYESGVLAIQEHGCWRTEEEYRCRDGSLFAVEVTWTKFFRTGTEAVYLAGVIRRIPEKQLNEREHLAAIGVTTTQLAHEIGNPLNGMSTTVQLLQRHLSKHKDTADDFLASTVQDLAADIHHLQSLLQELRSLARPQQLTLQPIDLAAVVTEILAIETPQWHECGIAIEQVFPADLPLVMGDKQKLA